MARWLSQFHGHGRGHVLFRCNSTSLLRQYHAPALSVMAGVIQKVSLGYATYILLGAILYSQSRSGVRSKHDAMADVGSCTE